MKVIKIPPITLLVEEFARKCWKNEAGLVNFLVVISAQFLLFLRIPAPKRFSDIEVGILGAHHEANLAGGISWNGSIGIFDDGEHFLAIFLEFGDQW